MGSLPLLTTKLNFWSKQFKWGRESIKDDPHTGCPVEATSEEMCQKLESLILADRQMKVSRLAEETGISGGAVWTIIHEKLDMSKVSARWVPRMMSFSEGHSSPVLSRELEAAH